MNHVTLLVILDGFGYRKDTEYNAIAQAHPSHFYGWLKTFPHAIIKASGTAVGLFDHMIGNSEDGHMTIGAGRIIEQPVVTISKMFASGWLYHDATINRLFDQLQSSGKTLHCIGLLSDAGIHSYEPHLFEILKYAQAKGIKKIVVHAFADGRDVPPKSVGIYLEKLDAVFRELGTGLLGSLQGRMYAMDRDGNWQRTQRSYEVMTTLLTQHNRRWQEVVAQQYAAGITDEFIEPIQLSPDAVIKPGDGVIFFNFRPDRARQLTRALIDPQFDLFTKEHIPLAWMITATEYSPEFPAYVIAQRRNVTHTFFDVLESAHKTIFTIAESEKYAHVTYFFNGGRELTRTNEERVLVPSLSEHHTYADHPAMSADAITHQVLESLKSDPKDFYLINYANADMVGHSGDFAATVKAIECLDKQLEELYTQVVEKMNGTLFITGDHGKAEDMWDTVAQQPRTAHTTNPVYFLMLDNKVRNQDITLNLHELSDIAPFLLTQMGVIVPQEMKRE